MDKLENEPLKEPGGLESSTPASASPAADKQTTAAPKGSRLGRFMVQAVRWLLGVLILVGLGYVLAVATLYTPAKQKLEQANTAAQEELASARLHATILTAQADISAARLAVSQKDPASARIALAKTGKTLADLKNMLPDDQGQAVVDMQERLTLALKEIGNNDTAASSDLDVLATSLLELENAYFTQP